MRKINTSDVFKMARIIKNANLKDKIFEIYKNKEQKDIETLGLDIIFSLIEGCCDKKIEGELYSFLGGLTGLKDEDVASLNLNELIETLKELIKENDLLYFFKLATQ